MTDIADFLAARIYEDELKAERLQQPRRKNREQAEAKAKQGILLDYMGQLRRWEARRNGMHTNMSDPRPSDLALKYLALPYADHPDYQPSWAPPEPGTVETWGRR